MQYIRSRRKSITLHATKNMFKFSKLHLCFSLTINYKIPTCLTANVGDVHVVGIYMRGPRGIMSIHFTKHNENDDVQRPK